MIRIKEVYADCSKEAEKTYCEDDFSVIEKYAAKTIIEKNPVFSFSTVIYLDKNEKIISSPWVFFNNNDFPKFGEIIYDEFEIYNEAEEAEKAKTAEALKEEIFAAVDEKNTSAEIFLSEMEIEALESEYFKIDDRYTLLRKGVRLNIKYISE